jgi:hypothetical protein
MFNNGNLQIISNNYIEYLLSNNLEYVLFSIAVVYIISKL